MGGRCVPLVLTASGAGVWLLAFHSARLTPVPRPSHFSSIFYAYWHGSCAQRCIPIRPCHKPSNSSQNRSKRRRFPSKRDQKGAHFVMPILTFCPSTPSGASARAVLPLRRGHFGVVQGSKMACGKVIHKMGKTGNRDSAFGFRQRRTANTPATTPPLALHHPGSRR